MESENIITELSFSTGLIHIESILKPTKAEGWRDIQPGDDLQFSLDLNWRSKWYSIWITITVWRGDRKEFEFGDYQGTVIGKLKNFEAHEKDI